MLRKNLQLITNNVLIHTCPNSIGLIMMRCIGLRLLVVNCTGTYYLDDFKNKIMADNNKKSKLLVIT